MEKAGKWIRKSGIDLGPMPEEVWEEPEVQLAYLELQECKARFWRMKALYLEARMKDTNCGAADSPGGGAAIYERFKMDGDAGPSGLWGASGGDWSEHLPDDFAR